MVSAGALVLGLDLGGSSTRALVVTGDGQRVATGRAGGANPLVQGTGGAAAALASALGQALAGLDPERVQLGVAGLAGIVEDSRVETAFRDRWTAAGLRCPLLLVPDTEVAFASGTPVPSGTVVIAGTGAAAAEIRDRTMLRASDGHGWLLGDDGSAFWLGREAVHAVLAALDGRGPQTSLTDSVARALLGGAAARWRSAEQIRQAVLARPPVELARLARLVSEAAETGDQVARRVIEKAARHLLAAACAVREARDRSPIVLAGGVLNAPGPVGPMVSAALERHFGIEPQVGSDGAGGGAWLALARLGLPDDSRLAVHLHARVTGRRL